MKKAFLSLLLCCIAIWAHAATVTVNATTVGSTTSSATSTTMTMSTSSRGFAVFDMTAAGIPAGSAVTSVTLKFTFTQTGTGTAAGVIYGYVGSIPALGTAALEYPACVSGTSCYTAAWGNASPKTMATTAAAQGFIQSNMTGTISMCWNLTASSRVYTETTVPQLVITYTPPCTGTPAPGNTAASLTTVCSGGSTVLSLPSNAAALGLSYVWYSAPDVSGVAGTYAPISGATNASYTATITATTWYKADVICNNTSLTGTSTPVKVSLGGLAQCGSFCQPAADCSDDDVILNVTFAGINNNTGCSNNTLYTSQMATVTAGTSPAISVTLETVWPEYAGVWIDFNQNGTFESSEFLELGTGGTLTGNFFIPFSATPGVARMRVRDHYNQTVGAGEACVDYGNGETEDYLVNILPPPPTITSTPTSISFGGVTTGTSSAAIVTNVTGAYLLPVAGSYTVTAPANFEVSTDGATWVSTFTNSYTSAGFTAPVYVRLNATAAIAYTGTVTVTGGGATVNIPATGTGAAVCNGIPNGGTANVSPTSGIETTSFALSLTGASVAGGLTYQWQSSSNGLAGSWANIPGATALNYGFTGISSTTFYRAVVTCPSYTAANSSTVNISYFPAASCIPEFDYPGDAILDGTAVADASNPFTLNGIFGTSINDATTISGSGYKDQTNTGMTCSMYNGLSYNLTIGANIYGYNMTNQIWIDFNGNGIFESDESVAGQADWTTTNVTQTIAIPSTVAAGVYRMRVMVAETDYYNSYPNLPPCASPNDFSTEEDNGDVRDYKITIVQLPPCVAPAAPTALTLTPAITNISGGFTAVSPAPDNYLIVLTTTNTPPAPVTGTTYTAGTNALGGKILSVNTSTTFNATGLTPGTTYWVWAYAYNSVCVGGPLYGPAVSNSATTPSCTISGIKTVGPTGTYATLTAAAAALAANGASGPVVLELQTTYASGSETFPVTFGNIPCASSTNTITIRPQGTLTISTGLATNAMLTLNGANYVIIDGRVGSTGTTKALTISNTTASGQAIRFVNDASNNIVRYVTLKGISTSATNGTIQFSTTNGTTGNDNNLIDNCDILDGTATYTNGIVSAGTAGKENSGNTVSNCNIANYFAAATATGGITLNANNSDWTISNNKFYQTASRAYTGTQTHRAITINSTAGNNFVVSGNTIGYSSNTGTGTYTMTSNAATLFQAIGMNVGSTTPSSVQGNTITGISFSSTSGAFTGIAVSGGSVNVGNVAPNIVGGGTGNGLISVTNSTTTNPAMTGISSAAASPAVVNIQNNIVGGITTNGSTATVGAGIYGIQASSSGAVTISGNTIGSTTTANSINGATVNTGSTAQQVYGINSSTSNPCTISGNTIVNLTGSATSTGGLVTGILYTGSGAGTISSNNINNINGANANTLLTGQASVSGIAYTGSGTGSISQNTVNALAATNAGAVVTNVFGISLTGSTNATIAGNRIYDLRNASTGTSATTPQKAVGIYLYNPSSSATVINNMISLGNGQTTNTSFAGIMNYLNAGALLRIYYNSVNIEGAAATGTLATAAFHRGSFAGTVTTPVDIRNNILNNTRTGGTGKHYAIANSIGGTGTNAGWAPNGSNYNLLNADVATIGYWGGADQTFASWKTTSQNDINSNASSAVTFVNTSTADLHLNMGTTPNNVEAHGVAISGITTDYDGQTRPGTTTVNGGGFAPDLGADEFDGVAIENLPPTITYTALPNACGTGDITLTANIFDPSGVPTTGALRPRIYYRKGSTGTWYSNAGVLSSGSTWTLTIVNADMGGVNYGDQISYYVVAQDNSGNVGAIPVTGFSATDVNTITTAPGSPNVYTVLPLLSGNYNIGAGGSYTTITAAIADYNVACLAGPVTFTLTDASYDTETFPVTVTRNSNASTANTLTIKPATGVNVTVDGQSGSNAIFKLLDANYVTIDGVNASGTSLTLRSNNTGTNAVVWLASTAATGPGNNNVAIKNTTIIGGSNTDNTNYGILAGVNAADPSETGGINNDNITIQGNTILRSYFGIFARGTANVAGRIDNWIINNNIIGPATNGANNIGGTGIHIQNAVNPTISNNTIQNLATVDGDRGAIYLNTNVTGFTVSGNTIRNITSTASSSSTSSITALYLGDAVINGNISRNTITSIASTTSGGYGCMAIIFNTGTNTTNTVIANNMISDVWDYQDGNVIYAPAGIDIDGSTGGVSIYYNSINLYGQHEGYPYNTDGGISACILVQTSGSNLDIRDNLLTNSYENTVSSGEKSYAIYSTAPSSSYTAIDYNDYYVSGTSGVLGYVNGDKIDLTALQTSLGGNSHSINAAAAYIADNNLRLQIAGANVPLIAGTPISITTDIYGTTRSTVTPVIGAHEVVIPPCAGVAAGVPMPVNPTLCVSGSTTITLQGASVGYGLLYQWKSSTDSVSWTNISGATNATYTIAPAITTTTFYRAVITCTLPGGTTDSSTTKVRVNPLPTITVSPDGGAYCSGSNLTMGASGAASYVWSPAYGLSATTGSAVNTTASATTTYTVVGTDINGCVNTHTTTVTVTATPPQPAVIAATSVICTGGSTMLTANGSLPPIIFANDFNTGLGAWTIDNTGTTNASTIAETQWTAQPDGYYYGNADETFNSPDNSQFAMTNADPGDAGSITHSILQSPAFSLAGYTSATLNYQHYFRSTNSSDDGNVEISIDGGSSWQNLVNYPAGSTVGSSSGFNTESINLATYLGNSNVMIRFNYNSPWGWYWAVDNVSVNGVGNYTDITWTPQVGLYTDPELTTPYTGGTALSVYAAPTALTTATYNTYTAVVNNNGCTNSNQVVVTVNPLPAAIMGSSTVCVGSSTTLSNSVSGGVWSSSNSNATVNSSGEVTGVTAGLATISYTLGTSCSRTFTITVNALPQAITGNADVCIGATNTLSSPTPGGIWSSSDNSTATISNLGALTGVAAGNAMITYALVNGCQATVLATVNVLPAVSVTPATSATVCLGDNAVFTAAVPLTGIPVLTQNFESGLGGWTITNLTVTPPTPDAYWQIVPSGATIPGDGTSMLQASPLAIGSQLVHTIFTSPSFSTIGYASANLTFNESVVSDGGDATIAVEYSVNNGPWTTLADYNVIGNVNTEGTWNAGTPDANIPMPANAIGQPNVKVRWNYEASSIYWIIDNINVSAVPPAATYAWSGADGLSCMACGTTTITPTALGANAYSVTATTSHNCMSTIPVTVSVNAMPAVISGTAVVCENATTQLTNTVAGGTWSSNSATNATVSASGLVTGVMAGTATITYTATGGCFTTVEITVNAVPAAITGTKVVCTGATTSLVETNTDGTWSSNVPTIASVDASGIVTGVQAGIVDIYYSLSTGCRATASVTVNANPSVISGIRAVCEGATTTLGNTLSGGTWSSSSTANATIDSTSGEVSGILAGTTTITYEVGTGCMSMADVTVNMTPAVITGTPVVCENATTALADATPMGVWTSNNMGTATVNAMGVVTGNSAGNATISFILLNGCYATTEVTVNPAPGAITGTFSICRGTSTTLSNTVSGGEWTSSDPLIAAADPVTEEVSGVAGGFATITYTLPEGCKATAAMTVNFVSEVYTVTGTGSYCANGSGVTIGLSGSDMNSEYQLYNGTDAVGTPVAGTGSAISFGTYTTAATYTVVANPGTSCSTDMAGDATISINPLPGVYDVEGTGNYCSATGGHVTLSGSDNDANVSYDLYKDGSVVNTLTGTGAALDFGTYTVAGTYSVLATNTVTGCNAAMNQDATIGITVTVLPAVTVTQNTGSVACVGMPVTFTASAVNGGSAPVYSWSVNGAVTTVTGDSYTYTPANGDVVRTVLHSNEVCATPDSAAVETTVTVSPMVTPSISIDATPGTNVCKGTMVTYTSSAINTGSAPVYTWVVNGGIVSTGTTYAYIPQNNDIVYCVLTSSANCVTDTSVYSNNELMSVDSGLIPIVNIRVLNGTYINVGQVDSFAAQVTNGGTNPTYKWYINGVLIPAATSYIFASGSLHNNDSVTVLVTNNGPCGYSTFNSVIIKVKTTGVTIVTPSQADLRLIPNPNSGEFVVNGTLGNTTDEPVTFEVTDMLGQVVYRGKSMSHAGNVNEKIQVSNTLANGMYMLNVRTAGDNKVFHFVLKQ